MMSQTRFMAAMMAAMFCDGERKSNLHAPTTKKHIPFSSTADQKNEWRRTCVFALATRARYPEP